MNIRPATNNDFKAWDQYVLAHPYGHPYTLTGWGEAIDQTYKHPVHYLMALDGNQRIMGVLSLVHMKSRLFGNNLFSMPFADLGGVLADDENSEAALIDKACKIAVEHGVSTLEFRQARPLCETKEAEYLKQNKPFEKVRMILNLPDNSKKLMASFKSKLRSQIKRPLKDGLEVQSGRCELLNDFYRVFAENMRDLGSPVHARSFIAAVLECLESSRLFVVYRDNTPLACSMVLGCGDALFNPWASSLRRYSSMSPNMLLYWSMLEYACDNGFRSFDFGRSTPEEGTFKFKQQWGAVEQPLHWEAFSQNGHHNGDASADQKSKFDAAIGLWTKMPVPVTRLIGPSLRKHIGL